MPFTPLHFGPGLLLKAAAPRHASFTAFVASLLRLPNARPRTGIQRGGPVHLLEERP